MALNSTLASSATAAMPTTVNTLPRTTPAVASPFPDSPVRRICPRAMTPSAIAAGDTTNASTNATTASVLSLGGGGDSTGGAVGGPVGCGNGGNRDPGPNNVSTSGGGESADGRSGHPGVDDVATPRLSAQLSGPASLQREITRASAIWTPPQVRVPTQRRGAGLKGDERGQQLIDSLWGYQVEVAPGVLSGEQAQTAVPQRTRVEAVTVEFQHLVEELQWCGFVGEEADRVEQVLAGLVQDFRVVGQVLVLVAGDYMARVERGDPIDSVEPCVKAAVATFEHHLVDAVVRDVAGDDEADRGHMERSGVVRVGMAGLDGAQNVAVQPKTVCGY